MRNTVLSKLIREPNEFEPIKFSVVGVFSASKQQITFHLLLFYLLGLLSFERVLLSTAWLR